MGNTPKVIHKRTKIPDRIATSGITDYGEIAINYASGDGKSFLTTRKADDSIAQFHEDAYWEAKIATASIESQSATSATDGYVLASDAYQVITDDELVFAEAANLLQEKIGLDEDNELSNLTTSNKNSIVDAINELKSVSDNVSASTSEISENLENYENVQADWEETDEESDAYILNKPTIPTTVAELTDSDDYVKNDELSAITNNIASLSAISASTRLESLEEISASTRLDTLETPASIIAQSATSATDGYVLASEAYKVITDDELVFASSVNMLSTTIGLDDNNTLSALTTTNKNSVVEAINELKARIDDGGSGSGNTYTLSIDDDGIVSCVKNSTDEGLEISDEGIVSVI